MFAKDGIGSLLAGKTHTIKRKVRSTLAAEALAGNECTENMDLMRAHFAEIKGGGPLKLKNWEQEISNIPHGLVVDCKSLFDLMLSLIHI